MHGSSVCLPAMALSRGRTPALPFAAVCVHLCLITLVNSVMIADTQPLCPPFLAVVGLVLHPLLRLGANHRLSI